MLLCLFLELVLQRLHTVFDLRALLVVNLVDVCSACVFDLLTKDPGSVEPHNTLFQLLVGQCVLEQLLVDVVFESLHGAFLGVDFVLHLLCSLRETLLSHAKVINDQNQVLVHSVEVFLFGAHFISLFVEFLNLDLLRADVSL